MEFMDTIEFCDDITPLGPQLLSFQGVKVHKSNCLTNKGYMRLLICVVLLFLRGFFQPALFTQF